MLLPPFSFGSSCVETPKLWEVLGVVFYDNSLNNRKLIDITYKIFSLSDTLSSRLLNNLHYLNMLHYLNFNIILCKL